MLMKILEEQKQLRHQMAVLQSSMDVILQKILNTDSNSEAVSTDTNSAITPAGNLQEIQELEDNLKNEYFFSKTVTSMTFICGSSGKARGLDSCYKLADYFFIRELLLNCSWTGTSRRQNNGDKIALKFFINTRKCFLSLVRMSDNVFGEQDGDKFFKTIIKNAKQKLNPKIMSTTKHRPKKCSTSSAAQETMSKTVLEEVQKEQPRQE